jgi:nucleolar protein 56
MVSFAPPTPFLLVNKALTPKQKQALDASLADINIDDPTAIAPEDVVMADGVTSLATEQAIRLKKKEKKEKKHKKQDEAEVGGEKKKKKKKSKAE